MASKKKPVLAICVRCLAPMHSQAELHRHSLDNGRGHGRFAYTMETLMGRAEAIAKAEELLAEVDGALHTAEGVVPALSERRCEFTIEVAKAYLMLAKMSDD